VDSNVNHFSSDNNEENLEEGSHDSNFEKYLKDEVKIESINVKKHEEIKFYEENKVIYSEEILNNKDSIIRTVHDNSKINRCETCGKNFKLKSHLKRHIISIHRGQRNFSCDICHETFIYPGGLERHKIKNHGSAKNTNVIPVENLFPFRVI